MAIGYFLDKTHRPSEDELRSALGSKWPLWEHVVTFIEDQYQIPPNLNFGGKNYGWNLWYRKSGKSLVSLFPGQECFVAQVVLGNVQVEKAMALNLGENVSRVLHETPQLHDGRWLFITVTTERDIEDIEQLLLVKRRPITWGQRKGL